MESYYPVAVVPLKEYKLLITFDNKEKRIFDVTPYLSDNFFAPLKAISLFNRLVFHTVKIRVIESLPYC